MAGSPISATAAQKGCRGMSSKHQRATDWVMPVWGAESSLGCGTCAGRVTIHLPAARPPEPSAPAMRRRLLSGLGDV